jgi:hypothetical protein
MSVMIQGPSSHGPSGSYRSHSGNRWTPHATTQVFRTFSAVGALATVLMVAFHVSQLMALAMAITGPIGFSLLFLVCVLGPVAVTVMLFRSERLKQRRAAVVIVPFAILLLSYLVSGLPAVIAVVFVVGSYLYLVYVVASQFIQTRAFALAVTALPLIGTLYYVPKALSNGGLVVTESAASETPLASALNNIQQNLQRTYPDGVALSYQIRGNRLYADLAKNGTVESVPITSSDEVSTPARWLERNLSRKLAASLSAGANSPGQAGYQHVFELLRPFGSTLAETSTVLVVDGELMNFPHQTLLPAKRVFRSVSLDTERIGHNIADWANSPPLLPGTVAVFNALPQSSEELRHLELPESTWDSWRNLHEQFEQAIPRSLLDTLASTVVTKTTFLSGLQQHPAVLMIVAHSDGFSIWLPNGERVNAEDIAAVGEAIRANRPRVFLFSCETARIDDVQSFAKVLLDHGAAVVAAPVTKVPVEEALVMFESLMDSAVKQTPLRINEAFEEAQRAAQEKLMELWVAEVPHGGGLLAGGAKESRLT